MTDTESSSTILSESYGTSQRRAARTRSLIPDADVPSLSVRWFHAVDSPIVDPISIRRAKNTGKKLSATPPSPSQTSQKRTPPKNWVPFSKRDSNALEKAYKNNDVRAIVPVNEDHLFEVDVTRRTIQPIYWEGPMYEVRRATWFMQGDGSKWIPCEENLAEQIELGYYKHKPYLISEDPAMSAQTADQDEEYDDDNIEQIQRSATAIEEKKLEKSLEQQPVEKQWNLLGPYLGQYIVYTGPNTAWLLYNTTGSKIAKTIITRLTNRSNLGGTRLLRGYPEVEKQSKTKSSSTPKTTESDKKNDDVDVADTRNVDSETMAQQETEDYENEQSEEEVRKIDHLVFVIHGIGQKMSERLGQNFVHDVNMLRKTMKSAYATAISATGSPQRSNGIQVLPVLWRHEISFGMASDDDDKDLEMDLGTIGADDGSPTLDELTLEGVPNIRLVVSDVLLDVPLYLTAKYRDQMTLIVTRELNRVYKLFVHRNPDFHERNGKISLVGHSLGSLLAFDILSIQPLHFSQEQQTISMLDEKRIPTAMDKKTPVLLFPVQNFFAVGSPLGVILLLRGCKIVSRRFLDTSHDTHSLNGFPSSGDLPVYTDMSTISSAVTICYPAVENLYNIFHKSDPVAYRLEPLIARQYAAKLKPEQIAYVKGGLKSMIDAGFSVGSGIANRAGAMYESFKIGLTTNLFMRGLGLSKQAGTTTEDGMDAGQSDNIATQIADEPTLRSRSRSDPALIEKYRKKASPVPTSDTSGAEKLRALNKNGRVDYCLQEGILENPYLSAFSAHMQYWQDLDVAAFLVRELYGKER